MLSFGAFLFGFGVLLQLGYMVTTRSVVSLEFLILGLVGMVGAVAVARARRRARRR
jgi:hypothetical protein